MKKLTSVFLSLLLSIVPAIAQPYVTIWQDYPTYAACTGYYTPYATPTDLVVVSGSASKVIKIQRVTISSTQTTAGVNQFFLVSRTVADTGGTSTAVTLVPMSPADPAATCSVLKYTAAPTINSTVGNYRAISVEANLPAATSSGEDTVLYDAQYTGKPITLNGTAQQLALNFAGAAVPAGLSIAVTVYETEQ